MSKEYHSSQNPKHQKKPLTARLCTLEPLKTPFLKGKKSRRLRKNAWAPVATSSGRRRRRVKT